MCYSSKPGYQKVSREDKLMSTTRSTVCFHVSRDLERSIRNFCREQQYGGFASSYWSNCRMLKISSKQLDTPVASRREFMDVFKVSLGIDTSLSRHCSS